jgi:hypothetical protein
MEKVWFIETYRGSGMPTGRVCHNHHRFEPDPTTGLGWWVGVGKDCYHHETSGLAMRPEEAEEFLRKYYY